MTDENDSRARLRRALAKAGREEKATPALRASLLALAAIPATTTTASAATAASVKVGATAKAATSIAAWKLVTIGTAIVAAGVTTTVIATRPSERPPSAVTTPKEAPSAPAPASASPAPSSSMPTISVSDLPPAPSASSAPIFRAPARPSASNVDVTAPPEPVANAARLAEEMKQVESIRNALQASKPSEAFRLCEEYRATFGNGALSEEAEVLRIDALAQMGRKAIAIEHARRFLEERPKSPYAARVRAIQTRLEEP